MLRDLFECVYVPTLCIRPSEIRALKELPETDKDIIFPIILLAPFANSLTLDKSLEKIDDAYGDRPYFLGIDRYYNESTKIREAQIQFSSLRRFQNGGAEYYDFIRSRGNIIPVIDATDFDASSFLLQVKRAIELDRGFLVSIFSSRQELANSSIQVPDGLMPLLRGLESTDFGVYLDQGWINDPIISEMNLIPACSAVFDEFDRMPLIVSTSSFPKDFTHYSDVKVIENISRSVFRRLNNRFNNEKIIYGDWASTKPRSQSIASTPIPRIDYATKDSWIVSRNKNDDWDFSRAALELKNSPFWNENLDIWGTYRILETIEKLPFSIASPQAAAAARINIHLHVQANYSRPNPIYSTDDPWVD